MDPPARSARGDKWHLNEISISTRPNNIGSGALLTRKGSFSGLNPAPKRLARCAAACQEALGDQQAAITLAAIHQKADQINSAGGYLRSLTDRAKDGKFSVWPMIMALLRAKLDGSNPPTTPPTQGPGRSEPGKPTESGGLQPSAELRALLAKRPK